MFEISVVSQCYGKHLNSSLYISKQSPKAIHYELNSTASFIDTMPCVFQDGSCIVIWKSNREYGHTKM